MILMKKVILIWILIIGLSLLSFVYLIDNKSIFTMREVRTIEKAIKNRGTEISKFETYKSERFGLSISLPSNVSVSDCSYRSSEDGEASAIPDSRVSVPLLFQEMSNGVLLYPAWHMSPYGKTSAGYYYKGCKKVHVSSTSLLLEKIHREYPYWMVISEEVKNDKEISQSIFQQCSKLAKFKNLSTSTQMGVFDVEIVADEKKIEDSSAVVCPDIVKIKYVPSAKRIYYLFNEGQYFLDDIASQIAQDGWMFDIQIKEE